MLLLFYINSVQFPSIWLVSLHKCENTLSFVQKLLCFPLRVCCQVIIQPALVFHDHLYKDQSITSWYLPPRCSCKCTHQLQQLVLNLCISHLGQMWICVPARTFSSAVRKLLTALSSKMKMPLPCSQKTKLQTYMAEKRRFFCFNLPCQEHLL